MARPRPPARTFKLGFGDYALSFGGKQNFRRTQSGVPSQSFLEGFIDRIKGIPAPTDGAAAPAATADFAGLFAEKAPRRGGFRFRPEVVRSMPAPPPETNGEASATTEAKTEAVTDTPVDFTKILHGGLEDTEIPAGFLASLRERPAQGAKGVKAAGVKKARQFLRAKG